MFINDKNKEKLIREEVDFAEKRFNSIFFRPRVSEEIDNIIYARGLNGEYVGGVDVGLEVAYFLASSLIIVPLPALCNTFTYCISDKDAFWLAERLEELSYGMFSFSIEPFPDKYESNLSGKGSILVLKIVILDFDFWQFFSERTYSKVLSRKIDAFEKKFVKIMK